MFLGGKEKNHTFKESFNNKGRMYAYSLPKSLSSSKGGKSSEAVHSAQ